MNKNVIAWAGKISRQIHIISSYIPNQIGYNISRIVMFLDERASLKVVLQMEQDNFPSRGVS